MKRLLLFGFSLFATLGFSQTTLFQDNLESGSSQWTLNTGTGANSWLVNNAYLGFAGLIPDTPNQPGSFTNGPQSMYMHITNTTVCGGLSVCNANFDTGSASNQNAEVATSIDASAYSNVTVSFWYLCAGQTATSFGTMEYSIDGGATWVGTGTIYVNTSSWTQESVSLPAWDNVAAFKFRFKWQNGGGGLDPAFSVDEILVTGTQGVVNSITTTDIQPQAAWCFGDITTLQVSFDAIGTYNAGNTFTAELSDATGSYAAPTVIGSITSSMSGTQLIPAAIVPGTIPAGNAYRIRVVASDPSTIGSDNGSDLMIYPLPTVTMSGFTALCTNGTPLTLTGGSPAGGSYTGTGITGGVFDPSVAGAGTANVTYTYVDVNGCLNTASESIVVNQAPTISFSTIPDMCDYNPDYTLVATPSGGTFAGPGVTGNMFSPSTAGIGVHTITYDYSGPNGCSDQSFQTVTVDACASLSEEMIVYSIYPNPSEGYFTVISDLEFESIQLKDLNGRLVQEIVSNELVNASVLSSGIYVVELIYLGQRYTERIMLK